MEWVNITAKTLPEAIDLALDNLGVDEAEAEIEVLEEPKQGLFGRLRGNARVRARVKPKATRPKVERGRNRKRRNEGGRERSSGGGKGSRNRKRSSSGDGEGRGDGGGRNRKGGNRDRNERQEREPAHAVDRTEPADGGAEGASGGNDERKKNRGDDNRGRTGGRGKSGRGSQKRGGNEPVEEATMEEVSEELETFLTGLTEAFGFEGDVTVGEDDGGLLASVEGRHGLMVGPKGRTLDAIQELARVTAQRSTPSNIRIKVDVGGYRALRREALVKFALEAADEARTDGLERSLEPMNAADRKVVHDALSELPDIETRSAGTDPRRRVVVVPVGDVASSDDDSDGGSGDESVADTADGSVDESAGAGAGEGVTSSDVETDAADEASSAVGEDTTSAEDGDDPNAVDESESVASQ